MKFVLSLGVLMNLICHGTISDKSFADQFINYIDTSNNSVLSNAKSGNRGIGRSWQLKPEKEIKERIASDKEFKEILEDKQEQIDFLYRVIYKSESEALSIVEKFYKLLSHVMLTPNRDKRYQGWSVEILSAIEHCNQKELIAAYSAFLGIDNDESGRRLLPQDEINNHAADFIEHYQLPRFNTSTLKYDAENTKFCGREEQISRLKSFANDERHLLWWAITGNGGIGKSRLAYEFMKLLNLHDPDIIGDWKSIMVDWRGFYSHIRPRIAELVEWRANRNYCIIIDNVQSFEQEIAEFVQIFAGLTWSLSKLRVILIERENITIDANNNAHEPLWFRSFKSHWNNIEWFNGTCYDFDFINLNSIDSESAISIVESYVLSQNKSISKDTCRQLVQFVESITNCGLITLLLLCAVETWLEYPALFYYHEMLSASSIWQTIIEKEKKKITKTESGLLSDALLDVHLIACIIHRVKLNREAFDLIFSTKRFIRYSYFKDQIISQLFYSPYTVQIDYNEYLIAIEPSIIGEYFAYSLLQKYSVEEYVDLFSKLYQVFISETRRFLNRYYTDFPNIVKKHPGFREIVKLGMVGQPQDECKRFCVDGVEYIVLVSFRSSETNKDYMVFTDNSIDEEGNPRLLASAYIDKGYEIEFQQIETEEEMNMIQEMIYTLREAKEKYLVDVQETIGDINQDNYAGVLRECEERALISESLLGANHLDTMQLYLYTATICNKMGDYKNAIKYWKKALKPSISIGGLYHPQTFDIYIHLAIAYLEIGDAELASEYLEIVNTMLETMNILAEGREGVSSDEQDITDKNDKND